MREPIVCLGRGGGKGGFGRLGVYIYPVGIVYGAVKDDGMRKAEPRKKRGKERKEGLWMLTKSCSGVVYKGILSIHSFIHTHKCLVPIHTQYPIVRMGVFHKGLVLSYQVLSSSFKVH